jgi:hypothetical protein
MVLVTFVLVYALCATVVLLAVAQDRRRIGGPQGRRSDRAGQHEARGSQHELVFTTQH